MATRNRIIYQSVALYSSPITGDATNESVDEGDVKELQRVTDINWGGEVTRQDINVMGQLANISREIIEEPVVNLDFTYFLANAYNESGAMGLTVNHDTANTKNLISGILSEEGASAERNYYILVVPEDLTKATCVHLRNVIVLLDRIRSAPAYQKVTLPLLVT